MCDRFADCNHTQSRGISATWTCFSGQWLLQLFCLQFVVHLAIQSSALRYRTLFQKQHSDRWELQTPVPRKRWRHASQGFFVPRQRPQEEQHGLHMVVPSTAQVEEDDTVDNVMSVTPVSSSHHTCTWLYMTMSAFHTEVCLKCTSWVAKGFCHCNAVCCI